jgi:hypothetical protein
MGSQVIRPVGQTYYFVDASGVQHMRYGSVHRSTLFLVDEEQRARELNEIIQDELSRLPAGANRYFEAKKLNAILAPGFGFKPYFGIDFV